MTPKKKHDPGYKLPEVMNPDTCCICIPIPNDFNHKMAFLGQLDELGYWWNWERDALKQGKDAAAVWRDIVDCIREDLNMSDCGCNDSERVPTNQRYTEDGHLEQSFDNGETWENADDVDPRFNSPIFPPLSGADGEIKKCKGANSVIAILKAEQAKSSGILDAGTGLTALAAAVAAAVAATGVGIVAAVIIALMSGILNAIINAGESVFTGSFTPTVWDDLLCILFCEIEDDGTFTEAGWTAVVSQSAALASYPADEWLAHMIRVIGPVGLTNASLSGVAGSMSCEGCDPCADECGMGWVTTTAGTITSQDATTVVVDSTYNATLNRHEVVLTRDIAEGGAGGCCFVVGYTFTGTGMNYFTVECNDASGNYTPVGECVKSFATWRTLAFTATLTVTTAC